jgi:hypothetical protein
MGLDHFVHVHILREELDYTISMLYVGDSNALRLTDPPLALYSCHQLSLQLAQMRDMHHSYSGPPRTRQRARMEAAQQDTTEPQAYPRQPQWDTRYEGGYSEYQEGSSFYYPHGPSGLSRGTGTFASAWYPN